MRSIKSPSPFNRILTAVLSLTLASGGTAVHLASQPTLTEPQERILDSATQSAPWAPPPCLAYSAV
ncbi:MAG: hypothetical protein AAFW84_32035 [Cyanobacteria bacterium J06635_15]